MFFVNENTNEPRIPQRKYDQSSMQEPLKAFLEKKEYIFCCQSLKKQKENVHIDEESKSYKQKKKTIKNSGIPDQKNEGRFNRDRENFLRHSILLCLASVSMYLNSANGQFVHDDISAVVNNKDALAKSPVLFLFSNDFWGEAMQNPGSHKSYRPLTVLSFRIVSQWFGLRPLPHHFANIALHSLVVWLLYWICVQNLKLSSTTSLMASLLFAVHPIHAEAVSGIVGRADLLAAVFFLLCFLSADKNFYQHWMTCLLSLLCLLCKETGIMSLPLVMAYHLLTRSVWSPSIASFLKELCFSPFNKVLRATLFKYTAVTMALVVLRLLLNGGPPIFSEQDNPASFLKSPVTRQLSYLHLWVFNWFQLLCPSNLSYDWQLGSIPLIKRWQDQRNLLTLVGGLVALSLWQTLFSKQANRKALSFSLLMLVLPFIPASNMFFPVGFVAAERTIYIPSIGFCVLISIGQSKIWTYCASKKIWLQGKRTSGKQILSTLSAFLLICLAGKLYLRNLDWLDRGTLFRSGLASTPTNGKVFYNYGNFLRDQENKRDARLCYKEALRLWPNYVIALNNLATVSDNETDIEQLLLRALQLDPHHANSLFNLGDLYRQQGNCMKSSFFFGLCQMLPECLQDAELLQAQCVNQKKEERSDEFNESLSLQTGKKVDFAGCSWIIGVRERRQVVMEFSGKLDLSQNSSNKWRPVQCVKKSGNYL